MFKNIFSGSKVLGSSFIILISLWIFNCSGADLSPSRGELPPDGGDSYERPVKYVKGKVVPLQKRGLKLKVKREIYQLPKLKKLGGLKLAVLNSIVWLGNREGLFQWQGDRWFILLNEPVVGLAVQYSDYLKADLLLIATPQKILIWKDGFSNSSLNTAIKGEEITTLTGRGKREFWLGTKKSLYRFKSGKLWRFEAPKGIKSILAFEDNPYIAVEDLEGNFEVWKDTKDQSKWEILQLKGEKTFAGRELSFEAIYPTQTGLIWGFTKGEWFIRKTEKGRSSWWPYFPFGEEQKITPSLYAWDDELQSIWILSGKELFRADRDEIRKVEGIEIPQGTKSLLYLPGEGLWMIADQKLHHLKTQGGTVSYQSRIAPFLKQNCTRCHRRGGSADFLPLTEYQAVKRAVDKIIEQLKKKRMPPPPNRPIGGDETIFEEWILNGFKR